MNELDAKISALQKTLEQQERCTAKAALRTSILFALLILAVAGYTAFLFRALREEVTPDALADVLFTQVMDRLPEAAAGIRANMKPAAQKLAVRTLDAVQSLIPQGGDCVRALIDERVETIFTNLEKENMPLLEQFLDESIHTVLQQKNIVGDEALGKAISRELCLQIDQELKKIIDANFYQSVNQLQTRLNKLRETPAAELSRKDAGTKRFLMCWLCITKRNPVSDTRFSTIVRTLNDAVEGMKKKLL